MHEGGVLLEEGRVYSMGVGGSCSRHNPRSVQSHPRRISHSRKETHSSQRRASTIRPELKMPCGAREGAGHVSQVWVRSVRMFRKDLGLNRVGMKGVIASSGYAERWLI